MAVVGAQYGSEGKGVIVNHMRHEYNIHVRVGGPNAGHSFYYDDTLFKMQVIPCGWANPNATLYIGRGGLIELGQLAKEIQGIYAVDSSIIDRLHIDARCGVLEESHHAKEGGIHGEMHQRIGSTGEGVGAVREARMSRDPERFRMAQDFSTHDLGPCELGYMLTANVSRSLNTAIDRGHNALLEGTQGSALSLIHGPWPYVTSADTNAAQLAADVGLSPRVIDQVMLVARTFPIRVAGNSGPLKDELTWQQMSEELGVAVEERTTVTKKIRRVGRWDWSLIQRAVALNRPTSFALTFADYLSPEIAGETEWDRLTTKVQKFVRDLAVVTNTPVGLVGTGGPRWSIVELGAR
jgi:adenylosuccinate synthase